MVKERPILFRGDLVRKILDGSKTQTRRPIKPQPEYRENQSLPGQFGTFSKQGWNLDDLSGRAFFLQASCPYGQPGDLLVVARPVPGFPGYAAGTNGVLYSKARGKWRPLKAHGTGKYPNVTVMDGKRKTTRNVHSLVCSAFYGPPPSSSAQVRHLDGDPTNNRPGNLAWGTQEENWQDRQAHGRGCAGEKHPMATMTDEERAHIRWAVTKGIASQRHVARVLGISQGQISQIMAGKELIVHEQESVPDRIPELWLEITGVRVERVQDISEADAKAEGYTDSKKLSSIDEFYVEARDKFGISWNDTYPGSWDRNDWVWVIEFKMKEGK